MKRIIKKCILCGNLGAYVIKVGDKVLESSVYCNNCKKTIVWEYYKEEGNTYEINKKKEKINEKDNNL